MPTDEAKKRRRAYVYTLNNPTAQELSHLRLITSSPSTTVHVAQLEEGESKTRHVQGVLSWKSGKTFTAAKRAICLRAHIEPCRDLKASIAYCCKAEGFIEEVARKGAPVPVRVCANLRPWQLQLNGIIDEELKEEDDRTIHWYWDKDGGTGKTSFCKWLVVKRQAIFLGGKATDAKYLIAKLREEGKLPEQPIFIWNCPRRMEQYFNYGCLESIKDGLFFAGKYESCSVCINSPICIVFANFKPDEAALSEDRWDIVDVDLLRLNLAHTAIQGVIAGALGRSDEEM